MQAWIHEVVEEEEWPVVLLTGRFECELDDETEATFDTLEAAIAWARERAEHVQLEFEGEGYDVTREPPPAAVTGRAALGRRRRAGQEWLDRTPQDPPVDWVVEVAVHPKDLHEGGPERERQDAVAAAAERALREAGFADVRGSAEELDAGLADIGAQAPEDGGDYGWTTSHALAYEITATARGSTRREVIDRAVQAAADAVARALGEPVWRHTTDDVMSLSWGVRADARPAGAEPLWAPSP